MTTKADRIRKLYADGFLTVKEIAALVGCRPEYVRVCARQRRDGKQSVHDAAYWQKIAETGDRDGAREAFRSTYRKLRRKGFSVDDAKQKSAGAYAATMRATYRHG